MERIRIVHITLNHLLQIQQIDTDLTQHGWPVAASTGDDMNIIFPQIAQHSDAIYHMKNEEHVCISIDFMRGNDGLDHPADGFLILFHDDTRQGFRGYLHANKRKGDSAALEERNTLHSLKRQFLMNMSHELRTPMNGVIGMAQLLQTANLNTEHREYISNIIDSSNMLLDYFDNILNLSRLEMGDNVVRSAPFDIRLLMNKMEKLFQSPAAAKGLAFTVAVDENVPRHVCGDNVRIQQVLMALTGNAVKFTHQGAILLELSCETALNDPNTLQLTFLIEDTGIGIPEDKLNSIFDIFSQVDHSLTRHYDGAGIGLAMASKLVHLMNGHIQVTSRVGVGTSMTVNIKAAANIRQPSNPQQTV